MKTLKMRKKEVPDHIFFTAQRSENMFYIFTSDNFFEICIVFH